MLAPIATTKSSVLGLRLDNERRAWVEAIAAEQGVSVRAVFEALIDRARADEGTEGDPVATPDDDFLNAHAASVAGSYGSRHGHGQHPHDQHRGDQHRGDQQRGDQHRGDQHRGDQDRDDWLRGIGSDVPASGPASAPAGALGSHDPVPPAMTPLLCIRQVAAISGHVLGVAGSLLRSLAEANGRHARACARDNWRIVSRSLH